MATMDGDPTLVDTNILVYSTDLDSPFRHAAEEKLISLRQQGAELWITRQVIREYIATRTRADGPDVLPAVLEDVQRFAVRYRIAEDGPGATERLFFLLRQAPSAGKQIHDANLVATMLQAGVSRLLTHNLDDFKRFERWITIVPLLEA